ncbi:hypothetical protein ACOME3_007574 [Neoechinorhynchus agilis]
MEYDRMVKAVMSVESLRDASGDRDQMCELCINLGGLTIFRKQDFDLICDGVKCVSVERKGSYRRCAGQGDVLSGVMGTFAGWTAKSLEVIEPKVNPMMVAAYAAGSLVRECAITAFMDHGRAVITDDIVRRIGPCFQQFFDD